MIDSPPASLSIDSLMETSGVKFGTSGARGLVEQMSDRVCYAYTVAFVQHLRAQGEPGTGQTRGRVAVAGDLRSSTGRIMNAVAKAVLDCGFEVVHCGRIPSPAVAWYGISNAIPSVMVTGSHIPDDRNGIKYNKAAGEILKQDEAGIRAQTVAIPAGLFDADGAFSDSGRDWLGAVDRGAYDHYVRRFFDFFPADALAGMHVGLYEHSTVARECAYEVLHGLGAQVTKLGFSERFVPVDTEAIRPEDVRLAKQWAGELHTDALVSADGDGDRPLVADESGHWLRGDVAGILCAQFLGADVVVTPVSCNTAVEASGLFREVRRTRIGSPYVIAEMEKALAAGGKRVVGYEANGGFLIASDIEREGRVLKPLPTRDALIVMVSLLVMAKQRQVGISGLVASLPARYTASDRLKEFPTELSQAKLQELYSGDFARDKGAVEAVFGADFGKVTAMDTTDGLRITFESGEIVHLRPSGNAPEFRCYNEADSEERAKEMNRTCMEIMRTWRAATEST